MYGCMAETIWKMVLRCKYTAGASMAFVNEPGSLEIFSKKLKILKPFR
jgi:hypothetical protein